MDRYISMGEKSDLMFAIGMAEVFFVAFLRTRNTVRMSFLPVVEIPGVLRDISFFHFEVTH